MMYNSFNGYNSNKFNPAAQNLQNGNIAGLRKDPTSVAGIKQEPSNVVGTNEMPEERDPFANVYVAPNDRAKQIMNSKGQNIIHNQFRGIKD